MKTGYWNRVWREFRKNRLAMSGLAVVGILLIVALLAPVLANNRPIVYITGGRAYFPALIDYPEMRDIDFRRGDAPGFAIMPPVPYTYSEYDLDSIVLPPGPRHIFGTDEQGRDLASRMIHGTRVSLVIGFVAVMIYVAIGIVIGAVSGFYGGWIDMAVSRFIEIVICFPTFFLILTVLAVVDIGESNNLLSIMVVIGLTRWTETARIVRGEFIKLRESDYVIAGRALGLRNARIILRHILPNALSPVLVTATFGVASTILIESSLSFLGFGVNPPTPSWGDILSQSREFMDFAWWLTLIPGIAIFLTITSYNLVGEGLQDATDPKSIPR